MLDATATHTRKAVVLLRAAVDLQVLTRDGETSNVIKRWMSSRKLQQPHRTGIAAFKRCRTGGQASHRQAVNVSSNEGISNKSLFCRAVVAIIGTSMQTDNNTRAAFDGTSSSASKRDMTGAPMLPKMKAINQAKAVRYIANAIFKQHQL